MDMTSYIIGRKSAGGGSDITIDDVIAITGELDNLDTTDKSNLVNAINEVASSGGGEETYFVEDAATFVLLGKKKGIYIFKNSQINLKFSNDFLSVYTLNIFPLVIYLYQDITTDLQDGELLGYYTNLGAYSSNYQIKKDSTKETGLSLTTANSFKVVMTDENQVINGKKEFTKLPESSIVPTNDKQFTNKKYVDDAVAGAGGGEQIPTLVLDEPYRFNSGGSVTDSDMLSFFSTRITEMLTETPKNGLVLIKYNTSGKTELWSCKDTVATQSDQYNFYLVNTEIKGANYRYALVVRGAWANDIFTCSYIMTVQDSYSFVLPNQVLTKTNTNSYTPTSNYHPSTKLYSDTTVLTKSGLSRHLTSKTYQVGDYVYRSETDLTIYKCNTADTTGTWDASKWDSKTYMEYLSDTLVGGALNGSY